MVRQLRSGGRVTPPANASVRPAKLLRIELSSTCDYRCRFCCWRKDRPSPAFVPFPLDGIAPLCEALVATGCHNINITGGEPLQLPPEYLCAIVGEIRSAPGIDQLWIASNGKGLMDETLCARLAATGLTDIAVSVAAGTNEAYQRYTGGDVSLDDILRGMRNAAAHGLRIRCHIPLNPLGMATFDQLETLLGKLETAGVTSAFYFRLHNSHAISDRYETLFIDPAIISNGFRRSAKWRYGATETGRPFFSDGVMRVFAPRETVHLFTANCRAARCGAYCQGVYSAYLVPDDTGWKIRSCQRIFDDRRNEHRLDRRFLASGAAGLKDLLSEVWRFAYGD